ncbi:MAG: hypothetical protein IT371_21320 [Deltaproteobacteria bacterium]|nr:hypothetical protein [Deltaproteobacteria bacterium]
MSTVPTCARRSAPRWFVALALGFVVALSQLDARAAESGPKGVMATLRWLWSPVGRLVQRVQRRSSSDKALSASTSLNGTVIGGAQPTGRLLETQVPPQASPKGKARVNLGKQVPSLAGALAALGRDDSGTAPEIDTIVRQLGSLERQVEGLAPQVRPAAQARFRRAALRYRAEIRTELDRLGRELLGSDVKDAQDSFDTLTRLATQGDKASRTYAQAKLDAGFASLVARASGTGSAGDQARGVLRKVIDELRFRREDRLVSFPASTSRQLVALALERAEFRNNEDIYRVITPILARSPALRRELASKLREALASAAPERVRAALTIVRQIVMQGGLQSGEVELVAARWAAGPARVTAAYQAELIEAIEYLSPRAPALTKALAAVAQQAKLSSELRQVAIRALGEATEPPLEVLRALALAPDGTIRRAAASALSQGGRRAVEKGDREEVRQNVALALTRLEQETAPSIVFGHLHTLRSSGAMTVATADGRKLLRWLERRASDVKASITLRGYAIDELRNFENLTEPDKARIGLRLLEQLPSLAALADARAVVLPTMDVLDALRPSSPRVFEKALEVLPQLPSWESWKLTGILVNLAPQLKAPAMRRRAMLWLVDRALAPREGLDADSGIARSRLALADMLHAHADPVVVATVKQRLAQLPVGTGGYATAAVSMLQLLAKLKLPAGLWLADLAPIVAAPEAGLRTAAVQELGRQLRTLRQARGAPTAEKEKIRGTVGQALARAAAGAGEAGALEALSLLAHQGLGGVPEVRATLRTMAASAESQVVRARAGELLK